MKINPEKLQFRSAYAVPIIQASDKICSWPSSFKFCGNSSLGIDDSSLVAFNCAMHAFLENRYLLFMEASVAFVVASCIPAAPSSVKGSLC